MIFSKRFIQKSKHFNTFDNNVPAPIFRRSFFVDKAPASACVTVCGLGFYELYINGKNVTKGRLAPYISNPDDILYYDFYEVARRLNPGVNVIALILGNGLLNNPGGAVWDFDKAAFRDAPKFALAFEKDGQLVFEADEEFKTADSPIVFDDYRAGEHYDARNEIEGWNLPGFDDSGWQTPVQAAVPRGTPEIPDCEPVSLIRELSPVKINRQENGFLFTFPENTAGVCRLKVNGKRDQKIVLSYGELLQDGRLVLDNICFGARSNLQKMHKDVYVCAGGRTEIYEPRFTYHGFQYVFAEGLDGSQILPDTLTALVIHSDILSAGDFDCSDAVLNKLQQNVRRSVLSNFYYFPTDCPHREKNGWTGDIALSAGHIMYNFHAERSLREWLVNVVKAQRADGALPGIVPTGGWGFDWGNGPAWDAALTETVFQIYRFSGDKKILIDNIDAVTKYIDYLCSRINGDGLVAFGLGDWCQAGAYPDGKIDTVLEITDSLISVDILRKAAKFLRILGADEKKYIEAADKIVDAFRDKYIADGLILPEYATQTATAMAVYYGAFLDSERQTAVDALAGAVKKNGRFNVGVLGGRVLFRVLARFGYGDLAYRIVTQKDDLSFGQHIFRGATTLLENFKPLNDNGLTSAEGYKTDSLNHHFWGDISVWMIECLAGLNVNPELTSPFDVEINPVFITALDYAKAHRVCMGEKISVEWRRSQNGRPKLTVKASDKFHIVNKIPQG
jgi:alpha-L-rhamnosidase